MPWFLLEPALDPTLSDAVEVEAIQDEVVKTGFATNADFLAGVRR
jgi:hypothetical protein